MTGTAIITPDGRYRYRLTRTLDAGELGLRPTRAAVFIMLNPSTADADTDDNTIRRCTRYAHREECTRLEVVNLFAYRTSSPKVLAQRQADGTDVIGPDNDRHIVETIATAVARDDRPPIVIAAWGAHRTIGTRADDVAILARRSGVPGLQALGLTAAGQPRHPLYLRTDAPLVRWPA